MGAAMKGALCRTRNGYIRMHAQRHAHFVCAPCARMKDPPSHSTKAGDEEAGVFSMEAPVRFSRWTLTVTGAGRGAIDKLAPKLSPKHLQPTIY